MTITREQAIEALDRLWNRPSILALNTVRQYISQSPAQPDAQQAEARALADEFRVGMDYHGYSVRAAALLRKIAQQQQERPAGDGNPGGALPAPSPLDFIPPSAAEWFADYPGIANHDWRGGWDACRNRIRTLMDERDRAVLVSAPAAQPRLVTAKEDSFLRAAAKRSATLLAEGRLVQMDAPFPPMREREQRRAMLHKGMLACYEVIDRCRKELAELDAADARAKGKK